jgi:hypothetical protein
MDNSAHWCPKRRKKEKEILHVKKPQLCPGLLDSNQVLFPITVFLINLITKHVVLNRAPWVGLSSAHL